ncbi:MAG: DinB family protein [Candidatus Hydrogenedentota bacterium]
MAQPSVLSTMKIVRDFTMNNLRDVSVDALLQIPEGFKNNILWNAGHIGVVQCELLHGLSKRALPVPEGWVEFFDNGTSPQDWSEPPAARDVMEVLEGLTSQIEQDYKNGLFDSFQPTELAPGIAFNTFEDAAQFHCVHEGLHLGVIMSLKKLV